MKTKKTTFMRHVALAVMGGFLFWGCGVTKEAPDVLPNDPIILDKELTELTVTPSKIKSQISFLASDEMAGRDTPSEELNIAARYLSTQLMQHGVQMAPGMDSYLQSVPLVEITPPQEGHISWNQDTAYLNQQFLIFEGGGMNQSLDFVFVNYGTSEDLQAIDVEGKIAVSLCGYEGQTNPQTWLFSANDKKEDAKKNGALGLVEIYNSQQIPFNFLIQYFTAPRMQVDAGDDSEFLHVWMNTELEQAIANIQQNSTKGQIQVPQAVKKQIETYNVVGVLPGTDPILKDEYIIYSAHYDHVGIGRPVDQDSIYNGARDNAVGSTTVLLAAENISQYPTRRSSIFIFFTGEEKGLLGSQYYADNPVIPLDRVAFCFNSDNAGYNDTSRVTIIGHERTTGSELITLACNSNGLEAKPDEVPEENLFDRSDNVNFAAKGVPAPTFGLGFQKFDDEMQKYYHQPADGPDNLDYAYLYKFFKSYVYACRLIANTDQRLFWVDGDKYYDAGVALYGNDKK